MWKYSWARPAACTELGRADFEHDGDSTEPSGAAAGGQRTHVEQVPREALAKQGQVVADVEGEVGGDGSEVLVEENLDGHQFAPEGGLLVGRGGQREHRDGEGEVARRHEGQRLPLTRDRLAAIARQR